MDGNVNDVRSASLVRCLEHARCAELPGEYVEGSPLGFWLRAVLLVRKRNGGLSYCIGRHLADGRVRIVRDFGLQSPVARVEGIYPYLYLDSRFVPVEGPRYVGLIARELGLDASVLRGKGAGELSVLAIEAGIVRQEASFRASRLTAVLESGGDVSGVDVGSDVVDVDPFDGVIPVAVAGTESEEMADSSGNVEEFVPISVASKDVVGEIADEMRKAVGRKRRKDASSSEGRERKPRVRSPRKPRGSGKAKGDVVVDDVKVGGDGTGVEGA